MKFKHYYISVLVRFLLIILFAVLSTWLYFDKANYIYSTISGLTAIFIVVNTINYFNRISEWISFFLLGIENEDSTLKFPKKTGNKKLDKLFNGLERLNNTFKNNKNAINTQEHYFKSLLDRSATGLFTVGSDERIVNINPMAEKLVGLAVSHNVNSLSNINPALPQFIVVDEENRNTSSAIFENSRGQKLNFKVSDIVINKDHIKLVAVNDITRELDNGEVDAWIKLARTLSHEIMNNIAPITSLSGILAKYFKSDGEVVELSELSQKTINNTVKGLEVIEERSAGLMSFVENYRKFTKLPEPNMERANIKAIMEKNLIIASAYENSDKVRIENKLSDSLDYLTDANLLSQVLINLLKNAIESLNDVDNAEAEERIIEIKAHSDGRKTAISISNNGPDILPEIKERIFVPFYTTKEEGSGIGLSLSKQIMTKMGGDIILTTNHLGWTSFWVYL